MTFPGQSTAPGQLLGKSEKDHGHLETPTRLLDRSPKMSPTLYIYHPLKITAPNQTTPCPPTHSALHAYVQQRPKPASPSLPHPIRGWVGKLHEREDFPAMGELHRLPSATQQHEPQQKRVASETNHRSLGAHIMDINVRHANNKGQTARYKVEELARKTGMVWTRYQELQGQMKNFQLRHFENRETIENLRHNSKIRTVPT
jgi:hypothetical protein